MACHIRMRLLSFNAEAFRDEMFCQQSTQQDTTMLAMISICRLTVTSNWQTQLACHRSWSPGQQLPARTIVSHRLIKLLMSCMVTASRIQDNRKATKHLRAQSSGYHSYKRVQLRLAPGLRRIAGEQVPANHHKQTMFCHSTNLFLRVNVSEAVVRTNALLLSCDGILSRPVASFVVRILGFATCEVDKTRQQ